MSAQSWEDVMATNFCGKYKELYSSFLHSSVLIYIDIKLKLVGHQQMGRTQTLVSEDLVVHTLT